MTIYNDGANIGNGTNAITGIGSERMSSPANITQNAAITANLIRTVNIKNVRAVSSTRIRVEFSQPISNDADSSLSDPDSFVLTPLSGAAVSVISRVDTPDGATATASVDLIVSEMTQGVLNYQLQAFGLFAPDDSPISNTAFPFNGLGVPPKVLVAFAPDANSVTVQFTEKVLDIGSLRVLSAYTFNDGLTVTGILSVDASSVTLKTSNQTPGHLYTLTMSGSWFDNSLNQLVNPAISSMLGFTAAVTKSALLSLKMYNFLIEGLRNSDQNEGDQFLERFLMGPQAIWAATMQTIFDLPNLWDVSAIPDELLQYLKRIVGWTHDLDNITDDLEPATLRRLIAASVRFWKLRGPEETISNILALTTAARVYVLNWFDLRFILDQTLLGEEHMGTDPWVLSTPGEGDPDSQTYNIRIVDDGSLDHVLVRNLAKLTRPSGERVQINYLGFLDRFESDGDETQWAFQTNGVFARQVQFGTLRINTISTLSVQTQRALVTAANNQDWTRQVISWTFLTSMMNFQLLFYVVGDTTNPAAVQDYYYVSVNTERHNTDPNKIRLIKRVAGVDTTLVTVDTVAAFGEPFRRDVPYTIRVVVTPIVEGSTTNSIVVLWDGEPIINYFSDATFTQGSIGFNVVSVFNATSYFALNELEMFFLPRALDLIDLGNVVTSIIPQPVIPPTGPAGLPLGALVNNSGVQLVNDFGQGLVV